MYKYKVVKPKDIFITDLDHFIRYQETTVVKTVEYNDDLTLKTKTLKDKNITFIDDWDKEKRREIAAYFKEVNGVVVFCYDKEKVIGFTNIELPIRNGYINMPYIHISAPYRGNRIAKELFYYISEEALKLGAKYLYISAHPSIETYRFYQSVGAKLTDNIIKELYDIEPYDLQLEKELSYKDIIYRRINDQYKTLQPTAKNYSVIASKTYKHMPKDHLEYIDVCKHLLEVNSRGFYSVSTLLLKRKQDIIDIKYIDIYEDILYNIINGWGQVDQFCYRVLNPILNDPTYFHYLDKWSLSTNKDIRRASLVSMIISSQKLTLDYPLDKVLLLVERLKEDEDFHVRKAVGWVLKCAYVTYKKEITNYLIKHKNTLDRMIYRYALEHAAKEEKKILMKKDWYHVSKNEKNRKRNNYWRSICYIT